MLLCTALLLPAGAAVGSSPSALQQIGPAPAQVAALTHYGLAVPTRTGLRSLVPSGWKTFIHQSVTLPPALSWSPGQAWTAVLENMGREHGLSVLVDWEAQTVLVRTPQIAADEAVTRKGIQQAAVTPLPKFQDKNKGKTKAKPGSTQAAAPAAAPSAPFAQAPTGPAAVALNAQHNESHRLQEWQSAHAQQAGQLDRLPVVRSNPTPSMVASLNKAVEANPPKLQSSPEFTYSAPSAWNKASARQLAQGIANKFQLRLVWAAPEEQLKGPVTLLAQTAEQDTLLLQKALGIYSAVELELLPQDKVLRAVPRGQRGQAWAEQQAWPMAQAEAPAAAATAPEAAPTPAPAPVPQLQLDLAVGVSLEEALVAFAHKYGYTLEWKVEGGFEAGRELSYTGDSLVQVLAQALPPLGISADVYTRDKHIVIRPGEARDR